MQAFCNNISTFYDGYSLVGMKAVSKPPVHEHVQREEHVSQALTLE